MDPMLLGALIGVGTGGLKYFLHDKPKEASERQLAADTQRYSPWTGLKAGEISDADLMGNMLGAGLSGAQFGAGVGQMGDSKKLNDAITKSLESNKNLNNTAALATVANQTPRQPPSKFGLDYSAGSSNPWTFL